MKKMYVVISLLLVTIPHIIVSSKPSRPLQLSPEKREELLHQLVEESNLRDASMSLVQSKEAFESIQEKYTTYITSNLQTHAKKALVLASSLGGVIEDADMQVDMKLTGFDEPNCTVNFIVTGTYTYLTILKNGCGGRSIETQQIHGFLNVTSDVFDQLLAEHVEK